MLSEWHQLQGQKDSSYTNRYSAHSFLSFVHFAVYQFLWCLQKCVVSARHPKGGGEDKANDKRCSQERRQGHMQDPCQGNCQCTESCEQDKHFQSSPKLSPTQHEATTG